MLYVNYFVITLIWCFGHANGLILKNGLNWKGIQPIKSKSTIVTERLTKGGRSTYP